MPCESAANASPRLCFAKAEIAKALRALELADSSELTAWMRVLELEDQVSDLCKERLRWKERGDVLSRILSGSEKDRVHRDRVHRLDEALRVWAVTGGRP